MRGHEPLIAMRMRGMTPSTVELMVDQRMPSWFWREWPTERHPGEPIHARILVGETDSPQLLDLRCLIGLTVQVNGPNPERVATVAQACTDAGAARVITSCNGAFTDTEGVLTWPN
jgi:hypothetical protein